MDMERYSRVVNVSIAFICVHVLNIFHLFNLCFG
jgi:hypothetical protein